MSGDDLDILDPQPVVVQFRGERLEIRPLTIGALPAFSRLVRPIVAEFVGGKHPEWKADDDAMVMDMLELHGESIVQAVAIATGKPVEFISGNQDSAELLMLAYKIVEVNRDFFIRALKSVLFAQSQAQNLLASAGGDTPSSTLSGPAIH
jgi:hypothetical protein